MKRLCSGEDQSEGNKRPVIHGLEPYSEYKLSGRKRTGASEWIKKNQSGFENVFAGLR
jgi:hypothetical protein